MYHRSRNLLFWACPAEAVLLGYHCPVRFQKHLAMRLWAQFQSFEIKIHVFSVVLFRCPRGKFLRFFPRRRFNVNSHWTSCFVITMASLRSWHILLSAIQMLLALLLLYLWLGGYRLTLDRGCHATSWPEKLAVKRILIPCNVLRILVVIPKLWIAGIRWDPNLESNQRLAIGTMDWLNVVQRGMIRWYSNLMLLALDLSSCVTGILIKLTVGVDWLHVVLLVTGSLHKHWFKPWGINDSTDTSFKLMTT